MNTRNLTFLFAVAILAITLISAPAVCWAQSTTVFATGLQAPTKIILTDQGNLIVAEAGTGVNTGRISVINRATGVRRTLLQGLPSGFAPPNNDPSGPEGLELRGHTLFVAIGPGDSVLNGPLPGTERANAAPSSPLFSSVLALHLNFNIESSVGDFVLTMADQTRLKNNERVVLSNGGDATLLTIELVVDFPDFVPNPRPDFAGNVRLSHPFGVVAAENKLYVVDASFNSVSRVDIPAREYYTLATFPSLPNPPAPIPGPPFSEAVPDSIRLFGDGLLVPLLVGFPFPPGAARVHRVNLTTGSNEAFISNLTSAIDVLPVQLPGRPDQFLVLEFSTNMGAGEPGRVRLVDPTAGTSAATVIASNLTTPVSMARDPRNGELFVAEIFSGRVMRVVSESLATTNIAPNISIVRPPEFVPLTARGTHTIEASAFDSDGQIVKVEFFTNGIKLSEDTTAPYTYTESNVPAGTYVLSAAATDNRGVRTTTRPITILVR